MKLEASVKEGDSPEHIICQMSSQPEKTTSLLMSQIFSLSSTAKGLDSTSFRARSGRLQGDGFVGGVGGRGGGGGAYVIS